MATIPIATKKIHDYSISRKLYDMKIWSQLLYMLSHWLVLGVWFDIAVSIDRERWHQFKLIFYLSGKQITKNRFSGNLGRIPLTFDVDSLTFSGTFKSQPVLSSISEKPSYNVSSKQNQSKRVPLGQPLKGLQILKSFQHQPTPLVNTEPKKTNIFPTHWFLHNLKEFNLLNNNHWNWYKEEK